MRRRSSLLAALALTLVIGSFAACETLDFRRSAAGESCARTDDCEAPLVCIAQTCVQPGSGGSGGAPAGGTGGTGASSAHSGGMAGSGAGGMAGAGGTTSSGDSTSSGGTGGTGGLDTVECHKCLSQECAAQEAACGPDCLAIEACIETLCGHLSEIGSSEEGACQVHCQEPHIPSKKSHLDVVNCALGAQCAPCGSYPHDYNLCRTSAIQGSCATQYQACNGSVDCQNYRDCVATCATLKDCLACDDAPPEQAGSTLLLDLQQCIAAQCIAESWLL